MPVPLWLSPTVCSFGRFLTSQIGPCLRQGPWAVMKGHSRGKMVKASHDSGWHMILGKRQHLSLLHMYIPVCLCLYQTNRDTKLVFKWLNVFEFYWF